MLFIRGVPGGEMKVTVSKAALNTVSFLEIIIWNVVIELGLLGKELLPMWGKRTIEIN